LSKASERAEHDALVGLVERILTAKRAAPDADTTALEHEIDERVYRLYGLTADEIKLVDEATAKQ
jgi:protein-arginine kinase